MGNIGYAILRGLLETYAPEDLLFTDKNLERCEAVKKETGVSYLKENAEVAANVKFLILAVKPVVYPAVLADLKDAVREEQIVISVAPGITVSSVREALGGFRRIIRIMPNTPALVGAGMTGYTLEEKLFTREEIEEARGILKSFSEIVQVEERLMDTVTTVSGSGPAYVYMFINALADAGVRYGLTKKDAIRMAAQTVYGSAKMVLETGEHPEVLRDNVCSPGGTTIAAVAAMDEAGFRNAILKGCEACYYKSTGKA
jgi:pyrroline-5-carboxylate reductase